VWGGVGLDLFDFPAGAAFLQGVSVSRAIAHAPFGKAAGLLDLCPFETFLDPAASPLSALAH
jgi:hypothetical protein